MLTVHATAACLPLGKGLFATIDTADWEKTAAFRWAPMLRPSGTYVYRKDNVAGIHVSLHRYLLGLSDPAIAVDHRDGNPLNNCRSNLRLATRQQNQRNRGKFSTAFTSRFKGVGKHWRSGSTGRPWHASISVNRKVVWWKGFSTEEEAARAYDSKARELFGEFARTNFEAQAV